MSMHRFIAGGSAAAIFACAFGPKPTLAPPDDAGVGAILQKFDEHHREVKTGMETTKTAIGDLKTNLLETGARLTEIEQKMVRRAGGDPEPARTLGKRFVESDAVKSIGSNWRGTARVEIKATLTSATADADGSAGAMAPADRQSGAILMQRRKLRIRDLFAPGKTSSNAIEWPKVTGRTNGAATQAEGATKGQSDMKFDLIQWPVRTIAHFMVASKQILDDAPALMSIVDGELVYGVKDVEDGQLLNGAGTGTDLLGVYTGATAFAAPFEVDSINMIDVLLQAIAQVEDMDYDADGIVLNPRDWRKIQSMKDNESRYLGGGPFTAEDLARLWAMPVVTTKGMTLNKFLVGPFRQGGQIFDREEATVEVSTEDSDNFRRNLVTIRGEERLALVLKHPEGFVKGDFSAAMSL